MKWFPFLTLESFWINFHLSISFGRSFKTQTSNTVAVHLVRMQLNFSVKLYLTATAADMVGADNFTTDSIHHCFALEN